MLLNYKYPSCLTISNIIGLLDLGATVNTLPYSVCNWMWVDFILLEQFVNQPETVPKELVKAVLANREILLFSVDFYILETKSKLGSFNNISLALGQLFIVTSNTLIRNRVIKLLFYNMAMKSNIFNFYLYFSLYS